MAFTAVTEGTSKTCYLRNKDHSPERANVNAISARMSCYEGKFNLRTKLC